MRPPPASWIACSQLVGHASSAVDTELTAMSVSKSCSYVRLSCVFYSFLFPSRVVCSVSPPACVPVGSFFADAVGARPPFVCAKFARSSLVARPLVVWACRRVLCLLFLAVFFVALVAAVMILPPSVVEVLSLLLASRLAGHQTSRPRRSSPAARSQQMI